MIEDVCREAVAVDGRSDEPSVERFMERAVRQGYCSRVLAMNESLQRP